MKAAIPVLGVLLILIGAVWFLQGIGVLPGSFMTGQIIWAIIGAVCIVGGGLLLFRQRIRPGSAR